MLDTASFAVPKQLPGSSIRSMDAARSNHNHHSNVNNHNSGRQEPQKHHHQDYHSDNHDPKPAADDEFHLSLPGFLTHHGHSLAHMDQKVLSECLQPVLNSLRNLDAESLLNLERVEHGARLCDGVNVRPIHEEVFPKYDCFGGLSVVRYIHITEVPEQYSIGIFVFPPFSRIPLHDHPEMCVLSRLLYGDLQCLSLDLLGAIPDEYKLLSSSSSSSSNNNTNDHHRHTSLTSAFSNSFQAARGHLFGGGSVVGQAPQSQSQSQILPPPGFPEGSRRAFKNPVRHLHAPDVSLLFPYQGNLHEFFAGPNGAAVLDILLPPYDADDDRDCTFYDIREDPAAAAAAAAAAHSEQSMSMDTDDSQSQSHSHTESESRTPCWIVPTNQPHDFHCLSGRYAKLGTNIISMEDTS